MAEKCYIIGVGGTGVRVARALIHLCDCGHIDVKDKEIKVLIIDSDENNGNKRELEEALKSYSERREDFNPDGNYPLFKTKLTAAVGTNKWSVSPVKEKKRNVEGELEEMSLEEYIKSEEVKGKDKDLNLMKALYSKKEYSKFKITQGFYAHPAIGALTFERWLNTDADFQNFLKRLKETLLTDASVKVFIVGSVFGGTGASGLPAVARKIRAHAGKKLIMAAGVFMPYFIFSSRVSADIGEEERERIKARVEIDFAGFTKAAKSALKFYKDTPSLGFNQIYALGASEDDSVRIVRNKHCPEGGEQNNWPHMLELFGALAVKDFFDRSFDVDKTISQWVGIGVKKDSFSKIEWKDLPCSKGLKEKINAFLLLSYLFVPSFLNRFINSKDGDLKEGVLRVFKDCDFMPLKVPPFASKPLLGAGSWRSDFDAEKGKLVNLNEYFITHADWFRRLLHDFDEENKLIFTGLLGDGYVINQKVKLPWNVYDMKTNGRVELGEKMTKGSTEAVKKFTHRNANDTIYQGLKSDYKRLDVNEAISLVLSDLYNGAKECFDNR